MKKIDCIVRLAEPSDINFIKNSWSKSFQSSLPAMDYQVFFREHEKLMIRLMSRHRCTVAVNKDDCYQIYGWMLASHIGEIAVIHYCYVKSTYRRFGVGSKLFSGIEHDRRYPALATHATGCYSFLKEKWNLTFNPYLLLKE